MVKELDVKVKFKKDDKKNTSLRLSGRTLKALKVRAIDEETSVQKIIETLIETYLKPGKSAPHTPPKGKSEKPTPDAVDKPKTRKNSSVKAAATAPPETVGPAKEGTKAL